MSRRTTDAQGSVQECVPSPLLQLPADHVLSSGAVLFPGAFDQHGCPLVVFPVDGQAKLSSELSKAEVVDFINYFLCLHNKKQEKESLVTAVADLRQASLPTIRFIAETLLLLELDKRTVHSVYIIQPKKKDGVKLLLKLLTPAKSHAASFKKVLLKEVSELSNYIDRSQLMASLGGYLIYCHQSWVAFIKEIDAFVQEFLSVVQRLPSSISTLQALSRLPLPTTFEELQRFCSTNEAKFQQLRRELGLDELLRHCESVVEKLRYPEKEPCYQAMAGTALFTHTTFDMLQNHSRITAAVEKVELLWQQTFSQARLQLQVFQLREDALQITDQIEAFLQEKLQPYKIEIAKDAAKAQMLVSHFEASIHTPAVALVRCAEDVIHTLAEILRVDSQIREHWVPDLERLKEKLHSAVHFILQTLRAVSNYHRYFNKANTWYSLVLCENFLQELLSGVHADGVPPQQQRRKWGTIPAWRHKLSTFLKKNPPPDMEELLHLAHLSKVVPDDVIQKEGQQMSQRCMTLRKLLISSGPVAVGHLQLALQWQYELLRSGRVDQSSADGAAHRTTTDVQDSPSESNLTKCESGKEAVPVLGTSPSAAVPGMVSAEGKPPSLSSFDSGFDGAGSSQLEAWGGREGVEGLSRLPAPRDSVRPATTHPQIHEENISSVSDPEDHREEFDLGSVGESSRASIQIIPKVTKDSLNFEIKVKRSAALPNNPWLSLPVDDLENSYTVTITRSPTPQRTDLQFNSPSDTNANHSSRSRGQPTKAEVSSSVQPSGPHSSDWIPHSQSSFEDPELSPIRNILSSTITDGRDVSSCTTEGIPTLLWDSYDLHDQTREAVDGLIGISQKDWDEKEQEGLREVEKMLGRTDEILEEEENVLAQEAVLDALLRSEDRHNQWPPWDSEHGVMSSSELAEAGVLGLEDNLDPSEYDNLSEPRSTGSASETKASEDDGPCTEAATEGETAAVHHSRPDLLTELRTVHILDELIMEEKLKIHELRQCEEVPDKELSGNKPSDANRSSSTGKEREAFRLQLEKEKREVENLEKSLDKALKVKKHKDGARKVVTCSIMDKARMESEEDRALCEELLSEGCNRPQRTRSPSLDQNEDTCKTENIQADLVPGVPEEAPPHDSEPQCPELTYSEADPSGCNRSTFNNISDLRQPAEESGIRPQECVYGEELDRSGENANICKPEASLTPGMRLDDQVFDSGGNSLLPPVPMPRKASLPVNDNNLTEHESPHSTERLNSAPSLLGQDPGFVQLEDESLEAAPENVTPAVSHNLLNPHVKEHSSSNNNNNNNPEKCRLSSDQSSDATFKTEEDGSGEPACLLHTDSHPAEEIQTLSPAHELAPQLAPDQPLEFDPGRGDELNEDLPDGPLSSEVLRISGSRSPGIQAQLNINTTEMMDFKTPIVLDTGSGLMKAGFSDQDYPNIIFPTIIGMPKYEEIMNGNLERETYIGHEAQHMRGVLALKHPIKNGIVRNWDEMEKIWHHTFQQLGVDPEDHPVLLTEAAMNPTANRQRMVEIMFECFSVPLTYVAMQAVLALYAAGRSTGVVFDSGDGVSHSVPVFEGYSLPHAVQRFPLAGVDVTMQLKKLLQEQGVSMRTTAEMEIVREMKEKCCCVALNYEAELTQGGAPCREMHYTMPDGQMVTLTTERFRAPEILFKPELIGHEHYGMHESVFKSVLSSDIDLRRCLLGNIVLSGGNTLLPGLPERLQAEIKGLAPADTGEAVRVTSPKDRDFSVWSGGAVLANLPTFSSAWIRREEYEEFGPQIVFRKCF
ncbi:uncharacterized protein LOC121199473 [Toxotes jaculatrix]|uniref:uncharacterized protein LOC121199473 n=1 Tax=Toxotes jaculatrix TaxID=941984 RepID=UPI001B3AB489|nr:uncharacterized protein LOC121199473 [Toxotes jaculatrix]